MNRLISELQRLYFPFPLRGCVMATDAPSEAMAVAELTTADLTRSLAGEATLLLDPATDDTTRCLVLHFAHGDDWPQVAALYQALQEDLALPAPAIAVDTEAGYQLWLSLAEAVPLAMAGAFLAALRRHYLAGLPVASLTCIPGGEATPGLLRPVPSLQAANGKWSAFIDPGMGSLFVAEAGLDIAPNPERQADLLAGLASIPPGDLQRALQWLEEQSATPVVQADIPAQAPVDVGQRLMLAGIYGDPQSFLLAVMNDPSASAGHRIEAAKALLPYFAKYASTST
ncbi:MAG: hypothetical protein LBE81_00945 [Azonexus sp.]|jgi:hypothetical protein|uniref:hypothetical protein n=1 Tax=Azonexus sp. TaxID=1872668 RepID=UPI002816A9A5|nr:hypothetical protein [Azonexus sp.]MDR0775194.1 hypothetical protein [Azonexus sp.]